MRRCNAGVISSLAVLLVACGDVNTGERLPTAPTRPTSVRAIGPSIAPTPGTCATVSQIQALVDAVFGGGSPNANSAQGKVKNIAQQVSKGNISKAQEHAFDLVDFVLKKARDKKKPLPGTEEQLASLINTVFCFVGTTLTIGDPDNAWIVNPGDQPQTLVSSDGGAGTQLPANAVTEPTLITAEPIPNTFPPGAGPLTTRLDQYPGFYEFTNQSASNAPLANPVVVAVCPTGAIAPAVLARMRLGHQAVAGFEITPRADASFLTCPTSTASTSRMSRWMRALASVITPKPLFAKQDELLRGGVGGTAGEFSPFAPVDPELTLRGGVGGTAGEFLKSPVTIEMARSSAATPVPITSRSVTTIVDGCTPVEGEISAPLAPGCRPGVVLVTKNGTVMRNVPVGWSIGLGGGLASPEASGACGIFGSTAATTTNMSGRAGICWNMGSLLGTNTVAAVPSVGGDAPAGVTFTPSTISFTATAIRITPMATATGEAVRYDGHPHPGSGTCSHGLTPALTYNTTHGGAPVAVGRYTLTVTCGDGGVRYNTQSASATIDIHSR